MSEKKIEFVKVDSLKRIIRNVNVIVKVVTVAVPRSITSRRDNSVHRVAEALVGDETGCILLNIWDDQISAFNKDDVIEVKNGYTSLFEGFLRLKIRRPGTAEKVEREIGEVNMENNLSKERHRIY